MINISEVSDIVIKSEKMNKTKNKVIKLTKISGVFIVSRIIIVLTILFFSSGAFFLNKDLKGSNAIPVGKIESIKNGLMHWDAGWYNNLVQKGYPFAQDNLPGRSSAFYYGYPMSAKLVSNIFGIKSEWALILMNNIYFFLGLVLMYKLCKMIGIKENAIFLGMLLYSCNPFAIFLVAGYSEGMYLFVSAAALILLIKKKYISSALVGGFLSGIRPVGVFYAPVLLIYYLINERKKFNLSRAAKLCTLTLVSIWGKLVFMAYNLIKFNNIFASEFAEKKYWDNGAYIDLKHRIINLIKYMAIPIKNRFNVLSPNVISIIMVYFLIFISAISLFKIYKCRKSKESQWFQYKSEKLLLIFWSLSQIILPLIIFGTAFNNPFSMGRYILPMFPLYIFAGKLFDNKIVLYSCVLCLFVFEMIILTIGYSFGGAHDIYVY